MINFGENNESFLQIGYALQVWAENRSYTSATNDASLTDTYLRRNRLTFSGQYNDLIVNATAVPEPAAFAAVGLAAVGVLARRRRQRGN